LGIQQARVHDQLYFEEEELSPEGSKMEPPPIQFVCPECHDSLGQNSSTCRSKHELINRNGIPSFVEESEFDVHWDQHDTEHIPETKISAAQQFLKPIINWSEQGIKLNILDAGCGDGVQMKVLSDLGYLSAQNQVGVDISLSAIQIAKNRIRDSWTLVRADIGSLPFATETFDVVYSYGALAYTNEPKTSFNELVRVLRPNGLIGIWIYPKTTGLGGILFSSVRKLCQLTGQLGTKVIASAIVPFLGLLPTSSNVHLGNASWKQCKEVVMVNISPSQLEFPTEEEVLNWFRSNGIEILYVDRAPAISVWGKMSSKK
jgi:ubiquinone/menaquinone biosynthesis C-methylase UbiE